MNIFDDSERKIICVSNTDNHFFEYDCNSLLLTIGKLYTVEDVEVHSYHTDVAIKEIPGKWFNSVCFEECDND